MHEGNIILFLVFVVICMFNFKCYATHKPQTTEAAKNETDRPNLRMQRIKMSHHHSKERAEETTTNNDHVILRFWDPKPSSIVARRRNQQHANSKKNVSISLKSANKPKGKGSTKKNKKDEKIKEQETTIFTEKPVLRSGNITESNDSQYGSILPNMWAARARNDPTKYLMRPHTMKAFMDDLNCRDTDRHDINMSLSVIGRTASYNEILMLVLSGKTDHFTFRAREDRFVEEPPEKPIVLIVHGLDVTGISALTPLSREPFETLLGFYKEHADKFEIYVIPMANPDGYEYVVTNNGTCVGKNRSPQAQCSGVALDRNFDVAWKSNQHISSCRPYYPGPEPFSELETRAMRDLFHLYGHKMIAYINVHASSCSSGRFKGDAVLYPRGYIDKTSDDDKYMDIKGEIDEALKNASFQVVSVAMETLHSWYGEVSGSSVDYASTVYGVPYAMEFLMQPMPSKRNEKNPAGLPYDLYSLNEIWKRVIDVVFKNIAKSLNNDANSQ